MKSFLKTILILLFAAGFQILLFLLTFTFGSLSTTSIKKDLQTNKTYSILSSQIVTLIDQPSDTQDTQSQADDLLGPFIKQQFTAEYLQQKTETFIDDTYFWMQGKTTTPPVISLKELKDNINAQNPGLFSQLQELSTQMKEEQKQAAAQDPTMATPPDSFDLDKFINSDFSIPVGKNLSFMKQGYQMYTTGLPIIAIALLLAILFIVLLSDGLKSKLRWAGATLLVAIPAGILPIFLTFFLSKNSLDFFKIGDKSPLLAVVFRISDDLVKLFMTKYQVIEITGLIFLLIGAIALLVIANFVSSPQIITKQKSAKPTKSK